MMTLSELKQHIDETFGLDALQDMVNSEGGSQEKEFKEKTGLEFEFIESERSEGSGDFDGWTWRWKMGERFFEIEGGYGSYSGCEMYDFDFYEVREVTKTVTVYERV